MLVKYLLPLYIILRKPWRKKVLFMVGVSQGFFDAQAVDKIFDFIKCFSI